MHLTAIFIILLTIFALFPLLTSLKHNIKLFLSFILSSITIIFVFQIDTRFNISANVVSQIYSLLESYFLSLNIEKDSLIITLRFIYISIFFFIIFIIYLTIFHFIILESIPLINKKPTTLHVLSLIIFRSLNIICLAIILLSLLAEFNQIWDLRPGFLNRLFKLFLRIVGNIYE